MKPVAVAGCELTVEYTSAGGENGVASITSLPSTTVKAEGNGVYRGQLSINVSGVTNSKSNATVPGPTVAVTMNPTSTKALVDGDAPIREDDTVTGTAYPTTTSSPPVTVPTAFTVKVTGAGQSSVRCN